MKLQVVVLAAGESSRFYPFNQKHKIFFNLGGKPLLSYTLESIQRAGYSDVILVYSGKSEEKQLIKAITPKNINLNLVEQPSPKGQGDAILQAREHIHSDFFVINANHLAFDQEVIGWEEKFKDNILYGLTLRCQTQEPWLYGVFKLDGDKILDIVEKPKPGTEPSNWRDSVVYLFRQDFLTELAQEQPDHYSFEKTIARVCRQQKILALEGSPSPSLKYPWHLLAYKNTILDQLEPNISPQATIADSAIIRGKVIIEAGAQIHDYAIIDGPAYIGRNALVGQFSLIRNKSFLETGAKVERYCDVRNSIIGEHSHIHSQFVGDSIIGSNCRIGAGFITANKRIDRENVRVMVKNTMTDSGQNNLGVIMGNQVKTGIRVSSMPGTVIGNHSQIWPSLTIKGFYPDDSKIRQSNI